MKVVCVVIRQNSTKFLIAILTTFVILSACKPSVEVEATPVPTPTQKAVVPQNDNVEALNAAQAALGKVNFGFAPLLREAEAKIVIEMTPVDELARLIYPEQPADPTAWATVDSFASAYAVRYIMLSLPQVNRVALGSFGVAGSVGDTAEHINHVAAWITFTDGSRAIVDMTPLSTNFAARHTPDQMMVDNNQIEARFAELRQGVGLDQWQPMTVVRQDNQLYYVLARVQVSYDRYKFSLRVHPVEPANPMQPMSLRPGAIAEVEINRSEFAALQTLVEEAGPTAFEAHPELLKRHGNNRQPLVGVLDQQLELLWHLITKFEHELPDPARATPTPVPTATATPTPTPSPTATPRKLPLVTS
jgi:hypothetical protein